MSSFRTALISTILAGLTFLSAGGYGIRFCQALAFEPWTLQEELIFSSAAGYAILAFIMMAAGALSVWTTFGAWLIVAGGLCLCGPFVHSLRTLKPPKKLHDKTSTIVMALCALWAFLLALAPITYYDSLVYHFPIPAAYAEAHHWLSMKELIYPAFPQNLEMLWTLGILLGGDTVANLISLSLSILIIAATGAFALRWLTRREGRLAMFLLTVMPAMLLLSSGGYVDVGVTLYVFMMFYALCLWWETDRPAMLILAGFLGGAAMGVKYTAGIPFAAGAVLIFCREHRPVKQTVKNFFLYTLVGLCTWAPWLVKNTIFVGNPFFPFFYGLGNPKLSPWIQEAAAGYFQGVAEYSPCSLIGFLRLPWDIAVRSLRFGGGMDILGDYGWAPFVFLLPGLAFCRKTLPPIARLMVTFAALFFVPWAFSRPVLRFLLPLAPVLALLSAAVWSRAILHRSRTTQRIARGLLTCLILGGFGYFFLVEGVIESFPVALGFETHDHYLTRKLTYYAASQFVNRLPDTALVLVLGDQRGYYYYNRRVQVSPVFNKNPLVDWANSSTSSQDLAAQLKSRRITHLLINRTEWARLENNYPLFPFTSSGKQTWSKFLSSCTRLVYHDAHCDVLSLI
jgi:4-amino-4-deoxy-L-arabinose transferase-like glycosyltransferase